MIPRSVKASNDVLVSIPHSVLVVDPQGRQRLGSVLERCGFTVRWSANAEAALFELSGHDIDAIVAALPLPGMGVAGLIQEIRVRGSTPVLGVTFDRRVDWVEALRGGVDDHVRAPCPDSELRARLLALIRRVRGPLSPRRSVRVGELTVQLGRGIVAVEPRLVLTPMQSTLLGQLAQQPGVVASDTALRERVETVHGPTSDVAMEAEMRGLQIAVDVASGVNGALEHLDGLGWRLATDDS